MIILRIFNQLEYFNKYKNLLLKIIFKSYSFFLYEILNINILFLLLITLDFENIFFRERISFSKCFFAEIFWKLELLFLKG